jgi:membrane-bound lytic murein transglycosylase A
MLVRAFIFSMLFFLCACAGAKRDYIKLEKKSYSNLDHWKNDKHEEALKAYVKSCSSHKKILNAEIFKSAPKQAIQASLIRTCKLAKQTKNPKKFFEDNFVPFLVKNKTGERGLFTGYYEVELEGSVVKTNKYKHPVYAHSHKVNTKLPRSAIEKGALKGKKLEIAYVADKAGLFFMHIQGSGKIKIGDGSYIKLGYAGQNGYPYYAIGSHLTKNNLIDKNKASAESIINWLNQNPHKAAKIMNLNESYVFFRERREHHPVGAMGVEVSAMRSLAVDRRYIPLGLPLWLETSYPRENKKAPLKPFHRIMIAQDVGGAIKGPIRGDVFFGSNKQAERYAWYMGNMGRYFIMVPKDIARYIR